MSDLHHATLSDGLHTILFEIGKHQPRTISHLTESASRPFVQDEHHLHYHPTDFCSIGIASGQPLCHFSYKGAVFVRYGVIQVLLKALGQSNPINIGDDYILTLINLSEVFVI